MPQEGYVHQRYPMWLHHPTGDHPSVLVHGEDEEAGVLDRWNVDPEENDLKLDAHRAQLVARADKAEVVINPRWSDLKLKNEVEKAEKKRDVKLEE